jgi:hypothetical protein
VDAREVAPDLWVWTGQLESIGREAASVYLKAEQEILLFDPILPPEDPEGFWKALDRDVVPIDADVHVVLTAPSHTRDTAAMIARYPGARLWAAIDAVEAVEDHGVAVTDRFSPGDPLPAGVVAYASGKPPEVVFWLPGARALVVGNVIVSGEEGPMLTPEQWLPAGTSQADLRAALEPLAGLEPELLLLSHGEPVLAGGAAALRAL